VIFRIILKITQLGSYFIIFQVDIGSKDIYSIKELINFAPDEPI